MNAEDQSYVNRYKQIRSFINDSRMNEVRQFYNSPSLWQIMKIARKENYHSAFLSHYLKPNGNHSLGTNSLSCSCKW
ncbi:MAG: PD-(D/E)XK nuclease family protein [Muribaculum sp.]|nr:PD-(D/E)XK nuclease family protein [Muribaculum sp.]